MKKIILTIIMASTGLLIIAFLLTGMYFQNTGLAILPLGVDVVVERNVPVFQNATQEFNVTLDVTIRNNATAIAIQESAPDGSTITKCSVANCKIIGNKLEILLFSQNSNLKTQNITYSMVLNSAGGIFSGTFNSVSPDVNGVISGDSSIGTIPSSPPSSGGGSSGGGGGGGGITKPKVNSSITNVTTNNSKSEIITSTTNNSINLINQSENVSQGFFRTAGNFVLGENNQRLSILGGVLVIIIILVVIILYRKNSFE